MRSTIYTDEHSSYQSLPPLGLMLDIPAYDHQTVNHSAKEYVNGMAHTNGIESAWAVLKRGLHGVYHNASPRHIGRYLNEFAFRLNDGNVKRLTLARMDSFIKNCSGCRITYKELIA